MIREYFALRRFLPAPWRFLRTRKDPMEGAHQDIPFRGGFSVRVRNRPMDRHIFHRIFARDEYRLAGVADGAWDTVFDVGAHIGLFSVRAAPLARRVLSFEPVAENFEMLSHNLSGARFSHVTPIRKAVAGRRGTMALYPSDNPSAHSMYPEHGPRAAPIQVETLTLEDVFREYLVERCDLLKLDCEGAEYEILAAVPAELWERILRIRMEYHPVEGKNEWRVGKLRGELQERGYRCEVLPSKKSPDKGHLFAVRAGAP
jgi:FkbM family methyltransferase